MCRSILFVAADAALVPVALCIVRPAGLILVANRSGSATTIVTGGVAIVVICVTLGADRSAASQMARFAFNGLRAGSLTTCGCSSSRVLPFMGSCFRVFTAVIGTTSDVVAVALIRPI